MYIKKSTGPKKFGTYNNHPEKNELIDKLLNNRISTAGLEQLRNHITAEELSDIIQRIYDLNEKNILKISAVEGVLRTLNTIKNNRRNKRFIRKIQSRFRSRNEPGKENNKVILAEGDSWFNYPILLTDLIDRISMEKDMAVYSVASGGDWLLNMLTAREYIEELSVLHPDVFLISGGGNDLVGTSRLAAVVDPNGGDEYQQSEWAQMLIAKAQKQFIPLNEEHFLQGVKYLSKDFFALLMFFHLQYSYLIGNLLKSGKFKGIQIITQGYDYPIPSLNKGGVKFINWYIPFIRDFLGHGHWLKTPLQMRGIVQGNQQRNILYAMIFLFNEMMIDTGKLFNSLYPGAVYHIDARGTVGEKGWTDELHPKPVKFMQIAEEFIHCIRRDKEPTFDHTFVVNYKTKQP
jgi:hypothetical protein